jgi:biopolymer transport protein ExbD
MHSRRLVIAGILLALLAAFLLRLSLKTELDDLESWGLMFRWERVFRDFLLVSLIGAGVLSILRGIFQWFFAWWVGRAPVRIFPEMELRYFARSKLRRGDSFLVMTGLHSLTTVWNCVLLVLLGIFLSASRYPSKGLAVKWDRQTAFAVQNSPWTETLGVYVKRSGQFLVNGRPIQRAELEKELRTELGKRMEWTIYFEADAESSFMDTAYSIDVIQALGAHLIWITPKMRQEMDARNGWVF